MNILKEEYHDTVIVGTGTVELLRIPVDFLTGTVLDIEIHITAQDTNTEDVCMAYFKQVEVKNASVTRGTLFPTIKSSFFINESTTETVHTIEYSYDQSESDIVISIFNSKEGNATVMFFATVRIKYI